MKYTKEQILEGQRLLNLMNQHNAEGIAEDTTPEIRDLLLPEGLCKFRGAFAEDFNIVITSLGRQARIKGLDKYLKSLECSRTWKMAMRWVGILTLIAAVIACAYTLLVYYQKPAILKPHSQQETQTTYKNEQPKQTAKLEATTASEATKQDSLVISE